jgi:hypothetical protein
MEVLLYPVLVLAILSDFAMKIIFFLFLGSSPDKNMGSEPLRRQAVTLTSQIS